MSIILRAANARVVARAAAPRNVRFAHFENVVDQTIPGGSANRKWFTVRFLTFAALGWGVPIFAYKFQMNKAGDQE